MPPSTDIIDISSDSDNDSAVKPIRGQVHRWGRNPSRPPLSSHLVSDRQHRRVKHEISTHLKPNMSIRRVKLEGFSSSPPTFSSSCPSSAFSSNPSTPNPTSSQQRKRLSIQAKMDIYAVADGVMPGSQEYMEILRRLEEEDASILSQPVKVEGHPVASQVLKVQVRPPKRGLAADIPAVKRIKLESMTQPPSSSPPLTTSQLERRNKLSIATKMAIHMAKDNFVAGSQEYLQCRRKLLIEEGFVEPEVTQRPIKERIDSIARMNGSSYRHKGNRGKEKAEILIDEFTRSFGSDINNLEAWQTLCWTVDVHGNLESVRACEKALQDVYANLYDLVDAANQGSTICQSFDNENEAVRYTIDQDKVFPRREAQRNPLLRFFLMHVFSDKPSNHVRGRRR